MTAQAVIIGLVLPLASDIVATEAVLVTFDLAVIVSVAPVRCIDRHAHGTACQQQDQQDLGNSFHPQPPSIRAKKIGAEHRLNYNMPLLDHKSRFLYVFTLLAFLLPSACTPHNRAATGVPAGKGRLIIEVSGLRNSDGELFISLFSGKNGFPDRPASALRNLHQKIDGSAARLAIDNLPYGDYAISLLHDEDLDGEMDSNIIGIPREGFGFSGRFLDKGQPAYDDVRFLLLAPEKTVQITVHYETVGRERERIMRERKQGGSPPAPQQK